MRMIVYGKKLWHFKYCFAYFIAIFLFACQAKDGQSQQIGASKIGADRFETPYPFQAVTLVYHRFGDNRFPSTNTSIQDFENHLKYLKENGFISLIASEVVPFFSKAENQGKKVVVITVDDGYNSFFKNGVPLLKKYGMKATLFVNTESVGWTDYMGWEDLKEISKLGIEIGHHSHSHAYFMNISDTSRTTEFENDLLLGNELFNQHLGYIPTVYAYPYGEFDEAMALVLKKHNFNIALAQNSGVWNDMSHPYAIPRFPVAGNFVGMEQFKNKVNMLPLRIAQPLFPIIVKGNEIIKYNIVLADTNLTSNYNCFVSGTAQKDMILNKDNMFEVSFNPPQKRRTLVTVTVMDKFNQWHWHSRLLINPEIEE